MLEQCRQFKKENMLALPNDSFAAWWEEEFKSNVFQKHFG
jgi:hypothetical protein